MFFLQAGQCALSAHFKMLKIGQERYALNEKAKKLSSAMTTVKTAVETEKRTVAALKQELEKERGSSSHVQELEKQLAELQKNQEKLLRDADDKGYSDGVKATRAKLQAEVKEISGEKYVDGYSQGWVDGLQKALEMLEVAEDAEIRGNLPKAPTPIVPDSDEEEEENQEITDPNAENTETPDAPAS